MKNGAVFRGTILELVPDDYVVIQLPNGTTRKVPAAAFKYAGPAATDPLAQAPQASGESKKETLETKPAAAAPAPPASEGAHVLPYGVIHTDRAHVKLQSDEPGLTFHLQTETAAVKTWTGSTLGEVQGYSRVCTAPCSVDVPAGFHKFGLSRPDGDVAGASDEISVNDGDTIRGSYHSNAAARALGWVIGVAGFAGGVGLSYYGLSQSTCDALVPGGPCVETHHPDTALGLGGVGVGAASLVAWWFLIHMDDSAGFEKLAAHSPASAPLP
jgi:hypothetical protein